MEKLAKSREIAQNKLILLYILSKARSPISAARLSEYVSQQRLMEYLAFRQHFNELAAAGYVALDAEAGVASGGSYEITGLGLGMLAELGSLLPLPWARRIDRTATPLLGLAKSERAVLAVDTTDSSGRNVAELAIQDGDRTIIRISMLAGSRQDARAICKRWKDNTANLYGRIVDTLTGYSDVGEDGGDADGDEVGEAGDVEDDVSYSGYHVGSGDAKGAYDAAIGVEKRSVGLPDVVVHVRGMRDSSLKISRSGQGEGETAPRKKTGVSDINAVASGKAAGEREPKRANTAASVRKRPRKNTREGSQG